MKFVILIYHNPRSRDLWAQLSAAQRAEGLAAYATLNDDLAASGELIVSEALADPSLGKRVQVRAGETLITDGPFAEVKEVLAGIYLVECEDLGTALQYAARVPEAAFDLVEVRPVMDLKAFEI